MEEAIEPLGGALETLDVLRNELLGVGGALLGDREYRAENVLDVRDERRQVGRLVELDERHVKHRHQLLEDGDHLVVAVELD